MTDDISNLILEHLRAIRCQMDSQDARMNRIELRLSSIENTLVSMRKDTANLYGDIIYQSHRYDRLADRIERIERRLGLINGEPP